MTLTVEYSEILYVCACVRACLCVYVRTLRSTHPQPRIHSRSLCFEVFGVKTQLKEFKRVWRCCGALCSFKVGAFSSSCSKLCNEWSLVSVRRAEAELCWFKRNRESTGTMRESTGTGHTAGDHVLVTAILSANFIVVLVYL